MEHDVDDAHAVDELVARYERQPDRLWSASVHELDVHVAARTLATARVRLHAELEQCRAGRRTGAVIDFVVLSDDSRLAVDSAHEAKAEAALASEAALELSRRAACALLADGLSFRDAATVLGVSHSRIQQLAGQQRE